MKNSPIEPLNLKYKLHILGDRSIHLSGSMWQFEVSEEEALEAFAELYNGSPSAARVLKRFPSERDLNFLVQVDQKDDFSGAKFVLKFLSRTNSNCSGNWINLRHKVLTRLSREFDEKQLGFAFPRFVNSGFRNSNTDVQVELYGYVEGICLGDFRPFCDPKLYGEAGKSLGKLDSLMQTITREEEIQGNLDTLIEEKAQEKFAWDMNFAVECIKDKVKWISKEQDQILVLTLVEIYEREFLPGIGSLRKMIIHNDANDYNLIVSKNHMSSHSVGIIDFGDMSYGPAVFELAIFASYLLIHTTEILKDDSTFQLEDMIYHILPAVVGYNQEFNLQEKEFDFLLPLIAMRLCTSVCMSSYQYAQNPQNKYLLISQEGAWNVLRAISPYFLEKSNYWIDPVFILKYSCNLLSLRIPSESSLISWNPLLDSMSKEKLQIVRNSLDDPLSHDIENDCREFAFEIYGQYHFFQVRSDELWFKNRIQMLPNSTWMSGIKLTNFSQSQLSIICPWNGIITSLSTAAILISLESSADCELLILFRFIGNAESCSAFESFQKGQFLQASEVLFNLSPGQVCSIQFINNAYKCLNLSRLVFDIDRFPLFWRSDYQSTLENVFLDPSIICFSSGSWQMREVLNLKSTSHSKIEILGKRKQFLLSSLSVSYSSEPLHIVRGLAQYLYTHDGQPYLDCVNNVAHLGHCHPKIIEESIKQLKLFNSNSRYVYQGISDYAEKLCALFPEPLKVCAFVNSGSEANELAIRMAKCFTGKEHFVVIEGGYHGNTNTMIDLSSYKFDGPGGEGPKYFVHKISSPDCYAGTFSCCEDYLAEAEAVISSIPEGNLAGILIESILSCGGQIVPPRGYLKGLFNIIRNYGGVCIADEVQVGFGRVGTHMWGFQIDEEDAPIPDIVTLGKPIGNEFPIGAVVTSKKISECFSNTGMEFFSTFGGTPVASKIGLAVLDVLERENLQRHANNMGNLFMELMSEVQSRHEIIGDVRGKGLFLGIEFVLDRKLKSPAAWHASEVVVRMKNLGFLLSTDGPRHNIIKIKPPMVFSEENVRSLVEALDIVLGHSDLCLIPSCSEI